MCIPATGDADGAGPANDPTFSTSSEDQRARILAALRVGPQTSYSLRRLGAYQNPTRIFELRQLGYEIETTRVSVTDREGFTHQHVALYTLLTEPGQDAGGTP